MCNFRGEIDAFVNGFDFVFGLTVQLISRTTIKS